MARQPGKRSGGRTPPRRPDPEAVTSVPPAEEPGRQEEARRAALEVMRRFSLPG
jgi:hypothetical protein